MESADSNIVEIISRSTSRRHTVEKLLVSAAMIQLYDWLLTLPQEARYIWRASWNWSKVLYLLTRYIPFASISLQLRNQFAWNPTPDSCKMTLHASTWLALIGFDLAEIVLAVRTYAVWKRDKRVGIGLALLVGLYQIPNVIVLDDFIRGAGYVQNPYPEIYRGCAYTQARRILFANWIIFTIGEGVVLGLMIISAVKTHREYRSNLMMVVYRDGIRFYLYIFCATLANILTTLLLPIDFVGVGSNMEVVLHSVLACRLMIGIREAGRSLGRKLETFESPEVPRNNTLEFAPRPSGENASMELESWAGPSRIGHA